MGGVSGSAIVDAAMETRILGPSMTKRGDAPGYSAGGERVRHTPYHVYDTSKYGIYYLWLCGGGVYRPLVCRRNNSRLVDDDCINDNGPHHGKKTRIYA